MPQTDLKDTLRLAFQGHLIYNTIRLLMYGFLLRLLSNTLSIIAILHVSIHTLSDLDLDLTRSPKV